MRILRNLNSKTKSMGDLMIRFEEREMIIIDVFFRYYRRRIDVRNFFLDTVEGELMLETFFLIIK